MLRRLLPLVSLVAVPGLLAAQQWDSIQVRVQPLRGGVYMLTGAGGNIGLSVGDDGAFLVDDQYAPLSAKILAAVKTVTPHPVKFVVNTHWHGDHTGGNENIGKTGAVIVAHLNVRKRMSTEQFDQVFNRRTAPSPTGALPVITFTDSVTLHVNGDDMTAFHVPPAHTDGDAIIHFAKANVIHMGDTYFNGFYPFVDVSSGGHVNGVIAAADRVLAICNAETRIIPGHGPVSNCAELRAYRDVVATVRDRVQAEVRRGRTLEQIREAAPTKEFDDTWGRGFIRPPVFVELVYRSLTSN